MTSKKDQILDNALELFMEKGFDATSISDILSRLSIARGTLYYHFESKEAIMDAIIQRLLDQVLDRVNQVCGNSQLTHTQKMIAFFSSMNLTSLTGNEKVVHYFNQPQNALFHEKSNQRLIAMLSPILSRLIQEGIADGVYQTDFPDETAELILVVISGFIDAHYYALSAEQNRQRLEALLYNFGRMLQLSDAVLEEYRVQFFN